MSGLAIAVAAVTATIAPATVRECTDEPAITWKVEGGFATLRPEAAMRGDALLDAIAQAGGRMRPGKADTSSAYDDIVTTLVDEGRGGAPLYKLTWWDRAQERYILSKDTLRPASVTIRTRFAQGGQGTCVWSVDGVAAAARRCDDAQLTLRRGSDELRSTISVRAANGAAATGCAAVTERLVVGLGDSYASGEGNPDRPTLWAAIPGVAAPSVTMPADRNGRRRDRLGLWDRRPDGPLASAPVEADAQWWDNACHRSLLSQQALAAMAHAAADRHRRVMFLSFACSGATVFDGVAGSRLDAPGALRPGGLGAASPALRLSQIEQLVDALCAERGEVARFDVPELAPTWRRLRIRGERPREPRFVRVPRCRRYHVRPDALLLSVGGNDVGFGGVGVWALLPPKGRLAIDVVPTINKVFGGGAVKGGFGLVCPGHRSEKRCNLNTDRLVGELPAMLGLLDGALATAGLGTTPVKLHASYPLLTRAEDGTVRGCFGDELGGELYEMLNEPWLPAYGVVLAQRVRTDWLGRWSFGIQTSEMRIINREVLAPLNAAIAGHAGWSVVSPTEMPRTNGICSADGELATLLQQGAPAGRVRGPLLRQFGWPRFVDGGWSDDRPSPTTWRPYAVRSRWVRTVTDAALTQSVLDGGTAAPRLRTGNDRLSEGLSGGLHPSLAMHAAIAEQLASRLGQAFR